MVRRYSYYKKTKSDIDDDVFDRVERTLDRSMENLDRSLDHMSRNLDSMFKRTDRTFHKSLSSAEEQLEKMKKKAANHDFEKYEFIIKRRTKAIFNLVIIGSLLVMFFVLFALFNSYLDKQKYQQKPLTPTIEQTLPKDAPAPEPVTDKKL